MQGLLPPGFNELTKARPNLGQALANSHRCIVLMSYQLDIKAQGSRLISRINARTKAATNRRQAEETPAQKNVYSVMIDMLVKVKRM